MSVLISIATMDSREMLRDCLRSIPAAADRIPVTVVVVDNVSTDGTDALLAAEFPAVERITNTAPEGFGANHNQALRRACQRVGVEFVLVLNDDTVLHPGAISNLVAAARSDPRTGAVTPVVTTPGGLEQPVAFGRSPGVVGAFFATLLSWPKPRLARDDAHWLSACCLLIPMAGLRTVGGFDERFFMYSEDVDLSLRMRAAGYRLWQTRDAVITHFGQATTGREQFATGMSRQLSRSAYQMALKHRGLLAAELESGVVRAALGLRGVSDLARARVTHRAHRRAVGLRRLKLAAYAPRQAVYPDRERLTETPPRPVGVRHVIKRRGSAAQRSQPEHSTPDGYAETVRDVVIAMAEGYSPAQVAPFLQSLRRTGYDGAIVLLMTRGSDGHHQLALEHGAEVVALRDLLPTSALFQRSARSATHRLAARGFPAVPFLMWLPRLVDATAMSCRRRRSRARAMAVANAYPIALARYAYYLAYLEVRATTCNRVLLSDVRDVLFQRDPFAGLGPIDELQVFVEDRRVTLGQCPYNTQWLELGYGPRVVQELRDRPIVCSGVTFGDRRSVIVYLQEMIAEFSRLRSYGGGTDQSCHNVLVHRGRLSAVRHANEDGPVYTMGHVPPHELTWDADSQLVASTGTPYSILHQYDRHVDYLNFDAESASVSPLTNEVYTR